MVKKKWSIIIVGYKSSIYIKWQLKILFDFNENKNFNLIIIDNSKDDQEFNKLNNLIKPYNDIYNNIKLIQYSPTNSTSSGQHGEAIEVGKKEVNSDYLLIHDPDFFWLKKNYLSFLEDLIKDKDAVGAPYPKKVAIGQEYFPSAFGCAYKTELVKNVSFEAYLDKDYKKSWEEYYASDYCKNDYNFYFDVGWQVRKKLSLNDDSNFISFSQINIGNSLGKLISKNCEYSFETINHVYLHNNKIIASHLFRGSHTGEVTKNQDPNLKISDEVSSLRNLISEFMYQQILKDNAGFEKIINDVSGSINNLKRVSLDTSKINSKLILYIIKLRIYIHLQYLKKISFLGFLLPIRTKNIRKKINKFSSKIHDIIYD